MSNCISYPASKVHRTMDKKMMLRASFHSIKVHHLQAINKQGGASITVPAELVYCIGI